MESVLSFMSFIGKEMTTGKYTGDCSLEGRLVVITGGNTGIGLETARELARRGATLVLGCRSKERGWQAVMDIIATTGNEKVQVEELDLLSLASVRSFADKIKSRKEPVSILINNAGMIDGDGYHTWAAGKSHLSDDGLEIVTQTNHLSHFLLTNLLKSSLIAGKARVINVSSMAAWAGRVDLDNINYEKDSSSGTLRMNYYNSKLMNVMFTRELSKRWLDLGVTSYSLHPGLVRTELFRNLLPLGQTMMTGVFSLMGKSPVEGAQTSIYLACMDGIEEQSGSFFGECRNWDYTLSRTAKDPVLAEGLWERSVQLVGLEE